MASRDMADCVPALQIAFSASCKEWKELYPDRPQPFPTCTHRDDEEQEILYMRDKNHLDDDGDGKIDEADEWRSNAKPGQSDHNKFPTPAVDIAFRKQPGTYKKGESALDWSEYLFKDFADIFKKHGGFWGGDWVKLRKSNKNDTPHYYVKV